MSYSSTSRRPSDVVLSAQKRSASSTSGPTRMSPSSRRTASSARRATSGSASGPTRLTAPSPGTRTVRAVSQNECKCRQHPTIHFSTYNVSNVSCGNADPFVVVCCRAKNTHPVDDRSAAFSADPDVKRFDNSRVQCRSCEKWIPILTDDNAAAIKTWKQHRDTCQPQSASSPGASTSKYVPLVCAISIESHITDILPRFNIANVPPPPKHLLALASSSSLPPPSASARTAVAQSLSHSGKSSQASPSTATTFTTAFKDYNPNNYAGTQESRRRNADQRAAALRADALLGEVEPNRVFCKMCQKWVQLRQDSTYCAYPWLQHRAKCLLKQ